MFKTERKENDESRKRNHPTGVKEDSSQNKRNKAAIDTDEGIENEATNEKGESRKRNHLTGRDENSSQNKRNKTTIDDGIENESDTEPSKASETERVTYVGFTEIDGISAMFVGLSVVPTTPPKKSRPSRSKPGKEFQNIPKGFLNKK